MFNVLDLGVSSKHLFLYQPVQLSLENRTAAAYNKGPQGAWLHFKKWNLGSSIPGSLAPSLMLSLQCHWSQSFFPGYGRKSVWHWHGFNLAEEALVFTWLWLRLIAEENKFLHFVHSAFYNKVIYLVHPTFPCYFGLRKTPWARAPFVHLLGQLIWPLFSFLFSFHLCLHLSQQHTAPISLCPDFLIQKGSWHPCLW